MPDTRRSRLARRLRDHHGLTYQQALDRLDQHTAAGNPLPRTAAELGTLAASRPAVPGSPATTSAAEVLELLKVVFPGTPATFTRQSAESVDLVAAVFGDPSAVIDAMVDDPDEYSATIGLTTLNALNDITWLTVDARTTITLSSLLARVTTTGSDGEPVVCEFRLGERRPLRSVDTITRIRAWVMQASATDHCPIRSFSPGHYLQDGTCAHAMPLCPTCAGAGLLADGPNTVECGKEARLPYFTPVCRGTGYWTGERA